MAEPVSEFASLIQAWREGNQEAAQTLYERYNKHVANVVRHKLHKSLRRFFSEQDVTQAVWSSIWNDRDQFTFESPKALVSYLVRVSSSKVYDATRHHLGMAKRDMRREQPLEGSSEGKPELIQEVAGRTPTPSQEVMAEECWEKMIEGLPAPYPEALTMLRQGHAHREVAAKLGLHPRNFQRILQRLRQRFPLLRREVASP
jgi:RNA polymerase sigma factor (sigma-70 family)